VQTVGGKLKGDRKELVDELYRGYGDRRYNSRPIRNLRSGLKRLSWISVVEGTKAVKRLMDIGASLVGLVVLAPLFLLVAALICLEDGGPAMFWQMRVGQWGREFRFPKFRSMVTNAEDIKRKLLSVNQHGGDGITFKLKKDPRITRVGSVIRKLSIDELPQLWCVLCGDMSLVGPRPPVPEEVARYTLSDRRRLDVRPGLTCIWQVSGRSELAFDQQLRLDLEYIESHSLAGDIGLLLKTIPAILSGRGAY